MQAVRPATSWLPWLLALAVVVVNAVALVNGLHQPGTGPISIASAWLWGLSPSVFAVLAALILSRWPSNLLGWLLMTPGAGGALSAMVDIRVAGMQAAPANLDPGLFVTLWFHNISWLLLIFPLFFLLQLFPTGRVVARRWRWLVYLGWIMVVFMAVAAAFSDRIGPLEGEWTLENPIGFVPETAFGPVFQVLWSAGLVTLAIGGAASTVVRYRRASVPDRQKIKLLLYAFGLYAAVYSIAALQWGFTGGGILDLLLGLSILLIPAAIAAAVLRHRLFDIDLIIRRTLVYAVLTGLLTAAYLGSVVLVQEIAPVGRDSSLGVAAATLLITALFNPLRRRTQALIDHRLYRSKYDAQQVVERFVAAARNQADLERLSADLLAVVDEAIRPQSGDLWIRGPVPS